MPWNERITAAAYPRRIELVSAKPLGEKVEEDAYTTILVTLDRYPEARAAVVRALRKQMGEPEDDGEDIGHG